MGTLAGDVAGSIGHAQAKKRVLGYFEDWRKSDAERLALCPRDWDNSSAKEICRTEVFDSLGYYFVYDFTSEGGKNDGCNLALGTALDYTRSS